MKTKTRAQNGTRSAHAHQLAKGWENLVHHDQKKVLANFIGKLLNISHILHQKVLAKFHWEITEYSSHSSSKVTGRFHWEITEHSSNSSSKKLLGDFIWKVLSIPHGEITDRCHLRKIFGVEGQRKHCRKSYEDSNTIKLSWTSAQVPGNTRLK